MAYPVSARFLTAVTEPYQFAQQVDVTQDGVTVAANLKVISGDVAVDRSADVRRTVSCTVVGLPGDLIPTRTRRTALDIYGNELVVRTGITYPDGTTELVPQGVFTITSSKLVDTTDGVGLALQGEDRAGRISAAKLLTPWATAYGTSVTSAISALANDRYPGLTVVNATASTTTFPTHVLEEKADPWADGIQAFAEAVGATAYFDRAGQLVVKDVPDLGYTPVSWRLVEGERCTVTSLEREYSTSFGAVNAVVVLGEGFDNSPMRAVAIDDDPESPTYYYGRFGPRPVWESSPLIISAGQAQTVADARGRELFGVTERQVVKTVPNPAIDEGDLIYVRRERTGFDDVLIVDSLRLPISYQGEMVMDCWVRRTVT